MSVREPVRGEPVSGGPVAARVVELRLEGGSVGVREPVRGETVSGGQVAEGMERFSDKQWVLSRGEERSGGVSTASEKGGPANGNRADKRTLRQILAARDAELAIGARVRQRIAGGELGKVHLGVLSRAAGQGKTRMVAATEGGQAVKQVARRDQTQSWARVQESKGLQATARETMLGQAGWPEPACVQTMAQNLTQGQATSQERTRVQVAAQMRMQTCAEGASTRRVEEERA